MKILIVTHTFLPKYLGGTEVCAFELAKQFIKIGHQVIIFCSDPLSRQNSHSPIESYYQGIQIITIPKNIRQYNSFANTYQDKISVPPFIDLLNNFKPDIIHYHHLMHLSTDLVQIGSSHHIPQVYTLHDFWCQCLMHQRITSKGNLCTTFNPSKCSGCLSDILNSGPLANTTINFSTFKSSPHKLGYLKNLTKKLLLRTRGTVLYSTQKKKYLDMVEKRNQNLKKTLNTLDLIIYPTKFLQNEFNKWKIPAKKSILSSDGINLDLFSDSHKSISNNIRFGYIGSIIPTKGLDMILKAWPKLITNSQHLKIYGSLETDKKYANTIIKLSKSLKNIEFCGTFPPNKISEIYSNIDVLIVPSRWFENAPLVIRNALHTKTPIIAVNLGSIPNLIENDKNGLLYENEDLCGLVMQMNRFIQDRDLISKMKNNFPKQKSIQENAIELIKYFSQLVNDNHKK